MRQRKTRRPRERLGENKKKRRAELSKRGQLNRKEEKKEVISAWNASERAGCQCC